MIVYEATKTEFIEDTRTNVIESKIEKAFREKVRNYINPREEISWRNSTQFMKNILEDEQMPDNCGIAIEYKLPLSSERIDFILTGKDEKKNNMAIVIELKQWTKASFANNIDSIINIDAEEDEEYDNEDNHIVMTATGGTLRKVSHPSYQVKTYAEIIKRYNEAVQKHGIFVYPCAYLHNYREVDPPVITSEFYQEYLNDAPVFLENDFIKFKSFIKEHIKYGDDKETIHLIDNSRMKPAKSLQDCIANMINQNEEFNLSSNQNVVYKVALDMAEKCKKDGEKRCLIVKGGPGTGKTVLAINLLSKLTNKPYELVCHYATKNAAVRNVFKEKLKGTRKISIIDDMFRSSSNYIDSKKDSVGVIIVDEAHRLTAKSTKGRSQVGENQVKEIINTAKLSIFFIDEKQRVTLSDIGTVNEIKRYSNEFGISDDRIEILELKSQFRCNGSDKYLAWLEDVLDMERNDYVNKLDIDYDIEVIDNPVILREKIIEKNKENNKSRLLAGYCWEWPTDGRDNPDIHEVKIPEYNFEMSWNLSKDKTFAISEGSIDQIGCIHTAQGLEFDYVGVIIGEDLRYENGKIVTDFTKRANTDRSLHGIKKMYRENPEEALEIVDEIIKNTYRTLLTRGQKGCYIYCEDKALAEYLKRRLNQNDRIIYSIGEDENYSNLTVAEDSEEYRYE